MTKQQRSGFGRPKSLVLAFLALALLKLWPALALAQRDQIDREQADKILAEFESTVDTEVNAAGDGCMMVAVFHGNQVVWSRGFGLADIENKVAATPDTIGRIGSITKSFTAVAICQLAERGVLNLDAPVRNFFPEVAQIKAAPAGSNPITFRMLASHTSGLVREPTSVRTTAAGPIHSWEAKVLESLPDTSFKTQPLTEYSYSNIGFAILGLAGSRAADQPFMSIVEKQILQPLKMDSSTFIVDHEDMQRRLAVGYVRNPFSDELSSYLPTKEHAGRGYKVPNGGIYSTVGDLAKFAAAMMGETEPRILTEAMRAEMLDPQAPATNYGLGFKINSREGKWKVVGHSGSVAGYRANLQFDLRSKWGIAALATSRYSPPTPKLLQDLVSLSATNPD